jgi:hypothetical protein
MNVAATINPNVGVEQARATRELLRAQIATNEALSSVTETCRELHEHVEEAQARAGPRGPRYPTPDPATPRLPPASPLWA